jgi:hemoglobin
MTNIKGLVCVFALLMITSGCAGRTVEPALYAELGGSAGVERIIDAFIGNLADDERVAKSFENTDIDAFRAHMIDQICALAGGPCVYEGRSMKDSHRGLGIDAAMFNVVVADLMQAMESTGTPVAARNELLGLLAPMYRDVVSRH